MAQESRHGSSGSSGQGLGGSVRRGCDISWRCGQGPGPHWLDREAASLSAMGPKHASLMPAASPLVRGLASCGSRDPWFLLPTANSSPKILNGKSQK